MTARGSCTLTHFDHQFLFFSGSLKNDYTHSCITYRLANIFYTTMTHNISDLCGRIHRQMPFYCLYTNSAWDVVKNVLRKPVLIGPIEFDIVIVRDMSEKDTENKVYWGIGEFHDVNMFLFCRRGRSIWYPTARHLFSNCKLALLSTYSTVSVQYYYSDQI